MSQKKTLEVNPRHPLIKELLKRVEADGEDETAKDMAEIMFETATLRSGFMLPDTSSFASRVEKLLRQNLGVPESATVEEDEDLDQEEEPAGFDEVPSGKATVTETEVGEDGDNLHEHEEL